MPRIALVCVGVLCAPSAFARSIDAFSKGPGSTIDARGQAWHPQYEDDGDYGESWFFLVQTQEGGTLLGLVSITNLGLDTFDGSWDVHFYQGGKIYREHGEVDRDEVKASPLKMDIAVGAARVWARDGYYRMTVRTKQVDLNLTLERTFPAQQPGNGRVRVDGESESEWYFGMTAPRGTTSGVLRMGGRSFDLAGVGHHDHSWATVKVPSFIERWTSLRVFDPGLTLVLHQWHLEENFGRDVKFGVAGSAAEPWGALRTFTLTPRASRKEPKSEHLMPTRFDVRVEAGGYTVAGSVEEAQFLESVDVLAALSWPVRTAIRAFYTDPFLIRWLGRYDLEVTAPDGAKTRHTGLAFVETNFF